MKISVVKDVEELEHPYIAGWNIKCCSHCKKKKKKSLTFFEKIYNYYTTKEFHWVYTKWVKTGTQTNPCSQMFVVALFRVGKRWGWLKCSLTDKHINKIWHIHGREITESEKEHILSLCHKLPES